MALKCHLQRKKFKWRLTNRASEQADLCARGRAAFLFIVQGAGHTQSFGPFQRGKEGFQNSEFEPEHRVAKISKHVLRVGLMKSESDLCSCTEI